MRTRITSTTEGGLSGSPGNYLPDYLEAASAMLKHEQHMLELSPPPQRHTLPKVEKDENFPGKEELKQFIAESYTSANRKTEWLDFYCITSYGKLERNNRDK